MRKLKRTMRNWHRKKIISSTILLTAILLGLTNIGAAETTELASQGQPFQHVVVIVFENAELNNILSNGPYFKQLYDTYGATTNYYSVCHPSAPDYLAMTSGATWQCGSDNINLYSTTNIGTLLQNKNFSWYGFMESMPSNCYRSNYGEYVPKHNPFVYYSDLVNSNLCKEHDVPLTNWTTLVDQDKIPKFSFISPNLLNDGPRYKC